MPLEGFPRTSAAGSAATAAGATVAAAAATAVASAATATTVDDGGAMAIAALRQLTKLGQCCAESRADELVGAGGLELSHDQTWSQHFRHLQAAALGC